MKNQKNPKKLCNRYSWNADSEKLWTFVSDIQEWLEKVVHPHKTDVLLTRILLAAPIHSYFYVLPCYCYKIFEFNLHVLIFWQFRPYFPRYYMYVLKFEFTSVKVDILRHLVHSRTLCILFWLFQNQIVLSIFFTFSQLLFVFNLQSAERTPGIWSWHKCINVLLWIKLRTKQARIWHLFLRLQKR